jgi:hypothetical protein
MNRNDIASLRLVSQRIGGRGLRSAKEVVAWMGAMQAQDYAMAKWAVGLRMPDSTIGTVERAIDRGEILRTHLLRPTWHFVAADDFSWMLALTAPRIKASLASRHRQLGLSEAVISKSEAAIGQAMRGGKHLTRAELIAALEEAGIATGENRASHIFSRAELDGILCSGAAKGGRQTYALCARRVREAASLTRDEALAALATRYFSSRGPATLRDFVWWSGLPVADAKSALEMVRRDFSSETVDARVYWFMDARSGRASGPESAYLLPAFDELLIGYNDRSASLPLENRAKSVSNNGMFSPIVVEGGQVTGTWKRAFKADKTVVEIKLFGQSRRAARGALERAAERFGRFVDKKVELKVGYR